MKQVSNITVAMMRDPQGGGWLAQAHLEYKNSRDKDVLPMSGTDPLALLNRCVKALEKKLKPTSGGTVVRKE